MVLTSGANPQQGPQPAELRAARAGLCCGVCPQRAENKLHVSLMENYPGTLEALGEPIRQVGLLGPGGGGEVKLYEAFGGGSMWVTA